MREIKFRAWDKDLNRMWSDPSVNYESLKDESLVWMQYTGLKDRNGKEIYEGDIRCGKYYFDTEDQTRFQVMKWDKKSTCFYWDGPEIPRFIGVEVIGNIHENPELLQTNESTSQ